MRFGLKCLFYSSSFSVCPTKYPERWDSNAILALQWRSSQPIGIDSFFHGANGSLKMPFAWGLASETQLHKLQGLSKQDTSVLPRCLKQTSTDNPPTPISFKTDAVDCTSLSFSPPQTTIPTRVWAVCIVTVEVKTSWPNCFVH